MITDPELEQWQEIFRSEQAEPAEIVARAKQAVRRFRLWVYAEVAVTVVVGGGMTLWSLRAHQPAITLLTATSIIAAWLFRLTNDWNDFSGVATATGSYLNILLRRLRSQLHSAEFGGVLYFVLLGLIWAWGFRELNIPLLRYLTLPANIFIGLATGVFFLWLALYRRKLQREIAGLEKLQTEFGEEKPNQALPSLPAALTQAISNLQRRLKKRLT